MKGFKNIHWFKDTIAGIVVALVSIPISMGYAQIAGLPVIYGLYGSLFPILIFAFITSSPQFVVGVDAMPAVMVGSLMAELGIAAESRAAMNLAPVMAIFVSVWFVIFFLFKAGRIVKYISTPVMGGFISGVGATIILMQVPKLFGGSPGTGEIIDLVKNIASELCNFNGLSFLLGMGTVVIILVCKKIIPKVPMTVVMMVVGALLQAFIGLDKYGVKTLPAVAKGFPEIVLVDIGMFAQNIPDLLIQSLSIAAVIMAQTLLATGNYAMKYNYKVDNNRELLAYAAMNAAGGVVGCCPVNGSVSRSGIADSMGAKSQWMSVVAAATMLLVLLFGTPLLKYLPVPVLTGIVMTALIGILDTKLAARLFKENKNEFFIFMVAFFGVLFLGTIRGVLIGVVLAFGEVAVRAVKPPVSFMGLIPGQEIFHTLERNRDARPIKGTVIYRFSGNLFFANIDRFQSDIEGAIKPDTKVVIVDARGIGSVDITAVDRLLAISRNYRDSGIHFYITEHDGSLNDQIKRLGGAKLIESGSVRRTITLALRDAGVEKPYALEYNEKDETALSGNVVEADERLSEFEWLFGDEAEEKLELMADKIANELTEENAGAVENEVLDGHGVKTDWGMIGLFDENEFLDFLEFKVEDLAKQGRIPEKILRDVEHHIDLRRNVGKKRLDNVNPHANVLLAKHRQNMENYFKNKHPEDYDRFMQLRKNHNRKH